jgi:hypothetical protein
MALAGWKAAALVVSGSLTLPSCAGETVNDPSDSGSSSDTGIGPGLCPVAVDSGIDTGIGPGICAVALDAAEPDIDGAVAADATVDREIVGGIC